MRAMPTLLFLVLLVAPTVLAVQIDECSSPDPAWIWCDDFEQDRLASYFEYNDNAGDFARIAGTGVESSTGMRVEFEAGEVTAGDLKLAFGRTPDAYMAPVDGGTADYREVYWRMLVRHQDGWTGGGGYKLSRATAFAASDWSQAMIAHVWSTGSPDVYLGIDPASGTDASGSVVTSGYNDFANLRWLGLVPSSTPIFDASHVGEWYCIEGRARLNDPGQSNGEFQLWINDTLEAERTGMNWVGNYQGYGINTVMFENYWNTGSPVQQQRYFDNIVVSTQRIGCGAQASTLLGDRNQDGVVNIYDFNYLLNYFGRTGFLARADANGDGTVNIFDMVIVGRDWGKTGMIPDATAPARSGGSPSGTLAAGTTNATLSLTTDEPATCRYASSSQPYDSMTLMDSTGGTTHSALVTGLADGAAYTYHVRCQDASGNTNNDDHMISFSVNSPSSPQSITIPSGFIEIGRADGSVKESGGSAFGISDFGGWFQDNPALIQVVSDATNPSGSGQALRFTYDPAYNPHAGIATAGSFTGGPYDEIYVAYWVYYEPGWTMSPKNYYLGAVDADGPTEWYTTGGGGTGAAIFTQHANSLRIVDSNRVPPEGVSGVGNTTPLGHGQWHLREELWVSESTPGAGDGAVYGWVDGQPYGYNEAVTWLFPTDNPGFNGLEWYADVNSVPATQSYRIGELVIAGRNRSVLHEPAGFTQLSHHTFTSEEEDGWFSEGSFGGVYNDTTSPGSAPSVLRATFPTGFAAGSAPGNLDLQVIGSPTQLYGRFWVKLSSNWHGQESGTNKITYAWIDNGPDFFISAEGSGSGPLELYGRMQGTTDTPDDRYLPPNAGDGTISRGDWHLVEYLLGSNTAANPDGTLRMWLDGTLTHDYTDLRFNDNGGKAWEWVEIFPIWGGTGSTVPETQYMSLDDYYVSAP